MYLVFYGLECMRCILRFRCSTVFFCKQKTAYEMRISDWSSDVCSSDLRLRRLLCPRRLADAPVELSRRARDHRAAADDRAAPAQIGRASCRDRVCQYV